MENSKLIVSSRRELNINKRSVGQKILQQLPSPSQSTPLEQVHPPQNNFFQLSNKAPIHCIFATIQPLIFIRNTFDILLDKIEQNQSSLSY